MATFYAHCRCLHLPTDLTEKEYRRLGRGESEIHREPFADPALFEAHIREVHRATIPRSETASLVRTARPEKRAARIIRTLYAPTGYQPGAEVEVEGHGTGQVWSNGGPSRVWVAFAGCVPRWVLVNTRHRDAVEKVIYSSVTHHGCEHARTAA